MEEEAPNLLSVIQRRGGMGSQTVPSEREETGGSYASF